MPLLALNDNPAAKAYQQAMFQQGQPAVMFFTDDIKGDYEQIKARGAEFTFPSTLVTFPSRVGSSVLLRIATTLYPTQIFRINSSELR